MKRTYIFVLVLLLLLILCFVSCDLELKRNNGVADYNSRIEIWDKPAGNSNQSKEVKGADHSFGQQYYMESYLEWIRSVFH